jgi:hypothetical protein
MVNVQGLETMLAYIAEKKNQLSTLNYNDENYDLLEEELHNLEDSFIEEYGTYLEEALADVHDELCPDTDVLLPIAYLAKKYVKKGVKTDGTPFYDVALDEGVIVDVDDYPKDLTRLVLVPGPTRLVLQVGNRMQEQVWQAR